jgi:PAS domain S-box-containing protein
LHVDDDASLLEISKLMLMDLYCGFEITHAHCADEGLSMLSAGHFDVVVSDFEMPQKDGLQFLKELREQNNSIPFILFTGKGREEVAVMALNLGADGYFNKQGNLETVYGELAHGIKQNVKNKQAERALRESELKFKLYVENSPTAVFVTNPQGGYEYVNDAASKLLGFSREEFLEMSIPQILFKEDTTEGLKKFEEVKATGRSLSETTLKTKDGSPVYVILNSVKLPDGKLIAFCENITDHKTSEEELRNRENVLQRIFDILPVGLWFADKDGKLLRGNPAGVKIWGAEPKVAPSEYGVFKARRLPSGEEMTPNDWALARTIKDKVTIVDELLEIDAFDGKKKTILNYTAPVLDDNGDIQGAIVLNQDITERKKAEEKLQAIRVLLTNAETEGKIGGFEFDVNTLTQTWTEETFRILEIDSSIGEPIVPKGVDFIDPPYRPMANKAIQRAITHGEPYDQEWEITTMKGNKRWVHTVGKANYENGKIKTISGSFQDITKCKETEEKLKESFAQIEGINEKLRVIGSLTRHDVGNKLMAAKSNLYLLKKRLGDNAELAKYIDGIESALNSSYRIFEFSRLYERIGAEKPSEMNVYDCFNQAVLYYSNLGTVKVVNECQGLVVVADSLLMQLFYNFIDNSFKHGEKVTQIRLSCFKDYGKVKLFYEDDGVGISDANKPKLFEAGFTTGKGSGLGLSMIKKMIEVYGWTITEEGEPGKGAKFTLTIPKNSQKGKENFQTS